MIIMANQSTSIFVGAPSTVADAVADNSTTILTSPSLSLVETSSFHKLLLTDAKSLVTSAVPIVVSNLASMLLSILCLHYVGQLGTVELAGGALGVMFCNMSGACGIVGLSSVLDTLLTQAYGADKHSRLISVYMQRAVLVCTAFGFISAVIWFNTEHVLIFLHQDPKVAAVAGAFART
eukprot:PhM_4_TR3062/c3_g1_i2/m.103076/K03327/TC.MATE, SLC47A, norM, mdtK, dinF; multidrug resistance protein, MATE family